ncbi:MAG: hypothetical protein H0X29_04080 [Parachlamydiaceae bacterium]|nr:hypothetical protein [Parachlamydiaceae bacterium]
MSFISSDSMVNKEIEALKTLITIVKKVGIPLSSTTYQNSRCEAIAFIVSSNRERFGLSKLDELIQDIAKLATKDLAKSACEVSWKIHQEVEIQFAYKIKQLDLGSKQKSILHAIHALYCNCKIDNLKKHQQGDIVNFAGVPRELVPNWYRNLISL